MKVLIGRGSDRRVVDVKLIETRKTTILVELADGNRITRKKNRDLPTALQIGTQIHSNIEQGVQS